MPLAHREELLVLVGKVGPLPGRKMSSRQIVRNGEHLRRVPIGKVPDDDGDGIQPQLLGDPQAVRLRTGRPAAFPASRR